MTSAMATTRKSARFKRSTRSIRAASFWTEILVAGGMVALLTYLLVVPQQEKGSATRAIAGRRHRGGRRELRRMIWHDAANDGANRIAR